MGKKGKPKGKKGKPKGKKARTLSTDKEQIEVSDSIEETCPFCKKRFIIGFDKKGDVKAFLHSLPPCQKFIELEPYEYLRQVNISLGAHN